MSHDSGIVPVEKPDFLLMSIVFLVFCNIAFGPVMNTILFVLYAVILGILPWLIEQNDRLPRWLSWIFDQLADRIQAYPQEVVLVVGIAALTIGKWLDIDPRWREFGLVILVVAGYWMSRRGSLLQGGFLVKRNKMMTRFFGSPPSDERQPAPEEAKSSTQKSVLDRELGPTRHTPPSPSESHSATREIWERKQRQRWEDWMREELDRLDGDYDRSNH